MDSLPGVSFEAIDASLIDVAWRYDAPGGAGKGSDEMSGFEERY